MIKIFGMILNGCNLDSVKIGTYMDTSLVYNVNFNDPSIHIAPKLLECPHKQFVNIVVNDGKVIAIEHIEDKQDILQMLEHCGITFGDA